ncbi:MAG: hypothetical protein ACYTEW_27225 [Planctomycetota bacterium]|jgi:hypothetical protein
MNKLEQIPSLNITPRPGFSYVDREDIVSIVKAMLLTSESDDFYRGVVTLALALGVQITWKR